MKPAEFIINAQRESKLVDALYLARYVLTTHNGLRVQCEEDEWPLDFEVELRKIDAALQMAGIDTTKPMQAPRRGQ
ncbi:hypothetical protein [Paraburkholderia phosphatilytica]|uniref:hypothetical protein n=1 Tax=Paraburkholderia phosphatilytica TaxID=2282883 RepID=UPI000E503D6A|nr:hypothetical protein [Paraburkholderia phosphatilytica]